MIKNVTLLLILVFSIVLFGCSTDKNPVNPATDLIEENQENDDSTDEEQEDEGQEDGDVDNNNSDSEPILTSMRTYIFGHSLIVHDPPAIATPSNETTVPHWVHLLPKRLNLAMLFLGNTDFFPSTIICLPSLNGDSTL